ncbi:MAG: tetratricopeptide repeat protein [Acidobacteriota bacterium]|nr:tetratricopeptide repeat protein [Acidobacteriota bacterium]
MFLVLALLLAAPAQAEDTYLIDLKVLVQLADTGQGVANVRVQLFDAAGPTRGLGFTDRDGMITFSRIESGTYRLRVSDPNLEEMTTDIFLVDRRQMPAYQRIAVRKKPSERPAGAGAPGTISTEELKVPKKARKEFEAGSKALEKNDLPEAQLRFQKAIEIYPQYAHAYNHLGVSFMRNRQLEKGREAFEKAVAINGSYAEALLNLAKVRFAEKKTAEAEALLEKAVAADPAGAEALTILANLELMENKLELAAANGAKVHDLEHAEFAVAHWIAGRAYEIQHKDAQAIAEYTIFLKESPSSALAEKARASLKTLRDQNYPH